MSRQHLRAVSIPGPLKCSHSQASALHIGPSLSVLQALHTMEANRQDEKAQAVSLRQVGLRSQS